MLFKKRRLFYELMFYIVEGYYGSSIKQKRVDIYLDLLLVVNEELSETQQQIFFLYFLRSMRCKDICRKLKISRYLYFMEFRDIINKVLDGLKKIGYLKINL